jgi:DNA repair photolyase
MTTCNLIYTPKGKALEYSSLACNMYRGCDHACTYCYAPNATHLFREEFNKPATRINFLDKLRKESAGHQKDGLTGQVLLSFTCDPYQSFDVAEQVTRSTIDILHRHGFTVAVLTKGGTRALRDLDLFTAQDAYAATMTTLDPTESLQWEPGAALPSDRMECLRAFHAAGIPTWVSLEPVYNPEMVYRIIQETAPFVDLFKVGKMNYHPIAKQIDWSAFAKTTIALLESLGKKYYIKQDLLPYLG